MAVSTKTRVWPGAPHVLSRRLREVRATLKEIGIEIDFERDVGSNKTRGVNVTKIPSLSSPASPAEKHERKSTRKRDAINEGDANTVSHDKVASPKNTKKHAQKDKRDGRDGRDAIISKPTPLTLSGMSGDFNCRYCKFNTDTKEHYESHIVMKHPRRAGY